MTIPDDIRRNQHSPRGEGTPENLTQVSAEGAKPVRLHRWNLSGKRTEQAICTIGYQCLRRSPELSVEKRAAIFRLKGDNTHG